MAFPSVGGANFSGPVSVIDGDTIDVGDVRVRLHGIDAPENDQKCIAEQGVKWACGAWVSDQLRSKLQGQIALCNPIETDKYGRMVATCHVDGTDIGQALVIDGLAFAYRKYSMAYDLDEKDAAKNDRGLHSSRIQSPASFRRSKATGRMPLDQNCAIKGNISADGTRIYHSVGQQFYERTGINIGKGERWFCTAADAIKAGWRAALR